MALAAKSPSKLLAAATVGGAWFALADRTARGMPPAAPLAPTSAPAGQPEGKKADDRAADRTAVLGVIESLTKAFSQGDAKALAALWTEEGEYVGGDGTTVRDRAALEKAYGGSLGKNPEQHLEFEPGEVRFPSHDTTVVEGHMKLRRMKSGKLAASRSSLFRALEDGKWLVFDLRADPFERADTTSNTYYDWLISQTYLFVAAGAATEQFLARFKDFPPRQRPASFTIDQAVEKMKQGLGGK